MEDIIDKNTVTAHETFALKVSYDAYSMKHVL